MHHIERDKDKKNSKKFCVLLSNMKCTVWVSRFVHLGHLSAGKDYVFSLFLSALKVGAYVMCNM